jgi:hypothetical protein
MAEEQDPDPHKNKDNTENSKIAHDSPQECRGTRQIRNEPREE